MLVSLLKCLGIHKSYHFVSVNNNLHKLYKLRIYSLLQLSGFISFEYIFVKNVVSNNDNLDGLLFWMHVQVFQDVKQF